MKIGAVIQARMGSSRLPGKVMLPLADRPVIDHVIERVRQCVRLNEITIATTPAAVDDVLVERAERNGVRWFRGSADDVLSRYYFAARESALDVVVRITSDCPLIDPFVTGEIVDAFAAAAADIASNAGDEPRDRTYPRGLDAEVFSFAALAEAYERATAPYQREHVTSYLYETRRAHVHRHPVDYSRYRWTLDVEDDYRLLLAIYGHFYRGAHDFYWKDILALMVARPDLADLNAHVEQTKLPAPSQPR
jgi:spore coat polysaccharide biosynthesis protein SpsF